MVTVPAGRHGKTRKVKTGLCAGESPSFNAEFAVSGTVKICIIF
jgi:hypothetical protein